MNPRNIGPNVLSWLPADQIEESAMQQIENLSRMPFIFKHVAVMPDCHFGMGATVGSVIPTNRAIIPAAVGVDIGCGMIAVKTPLTREDLPEDLSDIRKAIEHQVPLSAGHYNRSIKKTAKPRIEQLEAKAAELDRLDFYDKLDKNWRKQLGSLGSGNHFIEVVLDEEGYAWAFLHSGSRGVGNRMAAHHIKIAKALMEKWYINLPDADLAYLVEDTPEFDDYMKDLEWAQEFALLNREEMMERIIRLLQYRCGDFEPVETVQCHHNFTQREHHFGKNILVSRKGAIEAREGQLGLIPGSMGTRSYVVRGKGNAASFNTAPHGAGRRLSRNKARANFTMEDFDRDMVGIEVNRSEAFLDELPGAYKDIDVVMEQSAGLVEILHTFRQIVNV
ncbi:MAG: RtcB family protein, partial [Chloroflexi bacterium]|nr:RtcB family protein [Chloroflexota bacterium]